MHENDRQIQLDVDIGVVNGRWSPQSKTLNAENWWVFYTSRTLQTRKTFPKKTFTAGEDIGALELSVVKKAFYTAQRLYS